MGIMDEEAPQQTRAEYLREAYFRQGRWVDSDYADIPKEAAPLLNHISNMQETFAAALADSATADKAYTKALDRKRETDAVVSKQQRNLDIYKMALADAMEIPR